MGVARRRPEFVTQAEAELYEKTPKWVLFEIAREALLLADPMGVDQDAQGCDDADTTKRMQALASRFMRGCGESEQTDG